MGLIGSEDEIEYGEEGEEEQEDGEGDGTKRQKTDEWRDSVNSEKKKNRATNILQVFIN